MSHGGGESGGAVNTGEGGQGGGRDGQVVASGHRERGSKGGGGGVDDHDTSTSDKQQSSSLRESAENPKEIIDEEGKRRRRGSAEEKGKCSSGDEKRGDGVIGGGGSKGVTGGDSRQHQGIRFKIVQGGGGRAKQSGKLGGDGAGGRQGEKETGREKPANDYLSTTGAGERSYNKFNKEVTPRKPDEFRTNADKLPISRSTNYSPRGGQFSQELLKQFSSSTKQQQQDSSISTSSKTRPEGVTAETNKGELIFPIISPAASASGLYLGFWFSSR